MTATELRKLKRLIAKVVDYNWTDELRDYQDHPEDAGDHIFTTLVELDNVVKDTRYTPQSYLKDPQ